MVFTQSSSRLTLAAALLVAASLPAAAQTTVVSAPVGVLSGLAREGPSGWAVPMIPKDLLSAVVVAQPPGELQFPDAIGPFGASLDPDGQYYVEVVTGPLEGERLDVDTEVTIAAGGPGLVLSTEADRLSTLPAIPDGALLGARCVVRPYWTLADLQASFSPGLRGHDHPGFADGVWVWEDGGVHLYYLASDGVSWRTPDGRTKKHHAHGRRHHEPTDWSDKVLPPDASVLLDLHSRAQHWVQLGRVRTNAFRKNLMTDLQPFATGFPLDLSPAEIGAFADPAGDPATAWTGSRSPSHADQFHVLEGRNQPRLEAYFLSRDGSTWVSQGDRHRDVTNQPILGAVDLVLLRRVLPNPSFRIPPPPGL